MTAIGKGNRGSEDHVPVLFDKDSTKYSLMKKLIQQWSFEWTFDWAFEWTFDWSFEWTFDWAFE